MGNVIRQQRFRVERLASGRCWANLKPPGSIVEGNIFYLTQGELFGADAGKDDRRSRWDRNLYWRTDGRGWNSTKGTIRRVAGQGKRPEWEGGRPGLRRSDTLRFPPPAVQPGLEIGYPLDRYRRSRPVRIAGVGCLAENGELSADCAPAAGSPRHRSQSTTTLKSTPPGQWPQHAKVIEEGLGIPSAS